MTAEDKERETELTVIAHLENLSAPNENESILPKLQWKWITMEQRVFTDFSLTYRKQKRSKPKIHTSKNLDRVRVS